MTEEDNDAVFTAEVQEDSESGTWDLIVDNHDLGRRIIFEFSKDRLRMKRITTEKVESSEKNDFSSYKHFDWLNGVDDD